MATSTGIHVEIDDRIRQRPDVFAAVTDATAYLEAQATDVPPPAAIGWRFADAAGQLIQITVSDSAPPGHHTVRHNFWTRWILDPTNRKICVLRMWSELLAERSDQNIARINRLIVRLREEEGDGGENSQRTDE
jgi:hypothetical protein